MPEIRPARPEQDEAVARLFYETAAGMYDIYAGGSERAPALINAMLDRPGVGASRETVSIAWIDGVPAGVLACFPASDEPRRGNRFLRLSLRHAPLWRWPAIAQVERAWSRMSPDLPPADSLYVDTLATDIRFRRRGVATALLEFAAERARALGLPRVALETTEMNVPARALYESRGFRLTEHIAGVRPIPSEVAYVRELR